MSDDDRIDDLEDELADLRGLPDRVNANAGRIDDQRARLDRIQAYQGEADRREERRTAKLHARIDRLEDRMLEGIKDLAARVDAIASTTQAAARNGAKKGAGQVNWGNAVAYFIALVAGSAPIVAAIIAAK